MRARTIEQVDLSLICNGNFFFRCIYSDNPETLKDI